MSLTIGDTRSVARGHHLGMTSSRLITSVGAIVVLLGACALPPKSAGENDPTGDSAGTVGAGTDGPADSATSVGQPGVSTASDGSASSTGVPPSTATEGNPDLTCRDAIDCVVDCASELQQMDAAEPDLTCFLECEEGLTVEESLHLFELTECVSNKCIDIGVCDELEPTGTAGEPDMGSGTGSGSGGSGSSGGVSPSQCLDCILSNIFDEHPGGECQPYADACV